ncbi:xylose isomerase-like protein [Aspergillus heterothallicus]
MATIKVAVASNSLGKSAAGHTIHRKLQAAKAHGFNGVELAFECLDAHAATFTSSKSREDRLRAAARDIYKAASSLGLELIALNPFGAYDGLKNSRDVDVRLQEAELWCSLCQIMHIKIFQICTALYGVDQSRFTDDPAIIAENMRRLGHLAGSYGLQVAYEAPSWGIHNNTWQQVQKILDLVDLPNVGHCLDTFHIASREAGDPFISASPIKAGGCDNLRASLGELKCTINPANIVYFQLSDATLADPEQKGYPHRDLAQPAFMTQSRNCRIYPCEEQYGGCLPVVDVAKAVFDLGYRGWVSMEVFHTDMWDPRTS